MEIKTSVSYLKNQKCADVYTESQTDYVLPDYLGDVRKILFTEAVLRPSGRFAGGDEVEFSGIVVYNLIYLDSEGELSSVEFTSDYDYSVKCSGEKYSDSVADTRVSNYSVRLVGPRKINAKASLVGTVHLSESESVNVSGDAFGGEHSPEINMGSVEVRSSKASSVSEREYAEAVEKLEGAIADEVNVIYSHAEATVDEVQAADDSVSVKGKLRMCAVIKNGEEPAYTAEKVVSFEESVEFDGVKPTMILSPEITVSSLHSTVNADETGCEVVLSGLCEMCIVGEENQQVDLILDAYLKDAPTDNSYADFNYTRIIDSATVKASHNAEISRSEVESEGLREIVFLSSTPKIEQVELCEGCVNILGEIRYSGISSEMIGEKISYVGIKFSSPFVANVNLDCQNNDKTQVEVSLHTKNTTATLDSEKVYASCTLECSAMALEEKDVSILSAMSVSDTESYESDGAKITVYYPSSDDTLFSVAKRFHTSSVKIAKDNDITESVFASDNPTGSLSGVKKVIIY